MLFVIDVSKEQLQRLRREWKNDLPGEPIPSPEGLVETYCLFELESIEKVTKVQELKTFTLKHKL